MTHITAKLSVVDFQPQRGAGGRFLPGGTSGRPKGAKARASRDLLKQVKSLGPNAFDKLEAAVDAGERWAIELTFKYAMPPARTVEFEDMTPDDVIEAIRNGDITAAEARDITAALHASVKVSEVEELREQIAQLRQEWQDSK